MRVLHLIGFVFMIITLAIQMNTISLLQTWTGWHVSSLILNAAIISWLIGHKLYLVNLIVKGEDVIITEYRCFIKVKKTEIKMNQIRSIWQGKKTLVIRTNEDSIELPVNKLERRSLRKLSLLHRYHSNQLPKPAIYTLRDGVV
jgi:hypothetical protein